MEKELEKDICRKCAYYMQHYVMVEGVYRWAVHCTQGRLRPHRPDAKACERYKEAPSEK